MSSSTSTIDAIDIHIEGDLVLSDSALASLARLLVDAALREIEKSERVQED